MLFLIKNKLFPMQMLIVGFLLGSMWLKSMWDLHWDFDYNARLWFFLFIGIAILAVSDSALHGLLTLLFRKAYLHRYTAMVEFFRPQKLQEILVAGILAGTEELVFRGLCLGGLLSLNLQPWSAVLLTAVVFGLCHLMPTADHWPFCIWAIWEGTLLSLLYIWSDGSLLLCVVIHALHDVVGFALFEYQRKTGWLIPKQEK